jgi:hypothetical protein
MLNNMVSIIDSVVVNHRNHTRTNGIWGYVRYTLPPGLAGERNAHANPDRRTYIYAWRGEFCQVYVFAKLVC